MMLADRVISIKDLKVYYRIAGDPKDPPLVLLNGWGAKVRGVFPNSEKVVKEFVRCGFYVMSPEHPGLMRSETPETVWGPKEYTEYIEEFVDKLGLRDFILVGQSFGGAIATAYAAEHSKNIKALILVNAGLARDKVYRFAFGRLPAARYIHRVLGSKFAPGLIKKVVVWITLGVPWSKIEEESFKARAIMGDIFRRWSLPNIYSKVRAKTILVWGSNDMLFPLSSVREVEKEIPNAKLYTIFGGHSVLYTQTKKVVELISSRV